MSFLPNEAQFETGMLEILSDDPETSILQIELQGPGIPISQPIIYAMGFKFWICANRYLSK